MNRGLTRLRLVRPQALLPKNIPVGSTLIGLPSSGVHSNGFSLVRKCVGERANITYKDICPW